MKKLVILCFLVSVFSYNAISQSAVNHFNAAVAKYRKARELRNNGHLESDLNQIIDCYKNAIDTARLVKSENERLASRCDLLTVECLMGIGNVYSGLKNYTESIDFYNQAYKLWPVPEKISIYEITNDIHIYDNGKSYKFFAYATPEAYYNLFFSIRNQLSNLYYQQGNYNEAIKYDNEVLKNPKCSAENGFIAAYDAASSYYIMGDKCNTYRKSVLCLKYANQMGPQKSLDDTRRKNFASVITVLHHAKDTNCLKPAEFATVAIALSSLDTIWRSSKKDMDEYADVAYIGGYHDFNFLYAMLNYGYTKNDEEEIKKWQGRILENKEHIKYDDLRALIWRMDKIQNYPDFKDAIDKYSQKKFHIENTHILVGFDPLAFFIWKQYAFTLEYHSVKNAHEFRFNYIPNSPQLFIKQNVDNQNYKIPDARHFGGYQASYTLKFIIKGGHNAYPYIGPELRNTLRNYTDPVLLMAKDNANDIKFYNQKLVGTVYDLTFNAGITLKSRYLFLNYYIGLGMGYKTLTTDIDRTKYDIVDYRYKDAIWNKFYVPFRLGLQVGFVI